MLMGRDLVAIDSAPAGTIVGIGGLKSEMIVNSGTLSSTLDVPSFSPIYQDSVPILRVAVEEGFQIVSIWGLKLGPPLSTLSLYRGVPLMIAIIFMIGTKYV